MGKRSPAADPEFTSKAKAWREFEQLLARIERVLSPRGATVTSPDFIADKVTGQIREIDASIRYRIGSVDCLVIFECRERRRVQDSQWIEQIATKQRDVGAAKCVAVSSTGFSKGALAKADAYGIETRVLRKITESDIDALVPRLPFFYAFKIETLFYVICDTKLNYLEDEREISISNLLHERYGGEEYLCEIRTKKFTSSINYLKATIELVYNEMPADERSSFRSKISGEDIIISYVGSPTHLVVLDIEGDDKYETFLICGAYANIKFLSFKDLEVETDNFEYRDKSKMLAKLSEYSVKVAGKSAGARFSILEHRASGKKVTFDDGNMKALALDLFDGEIPDILKGRR